MVSRVVDEVRALNLSICIALIRAGGIGMDRLKTISLISDYEAAMLTRMAPASRKRWRLRI
jgi:hypothetical protein